MVNVNVKFLGTSDDVTVCDCCGKQNLKFTVALDIDGAVVHYGRVCAGRNLKRPAKDVLAAARDADRVAADARRAAEWARRAAEEAPWFAFLAANGKGSDNFTRIESLGGYAAARATYFAQEVR